MGVGGVSYMIIISIVTNAYYLLDYTFYIK